MTGIIALAVPMVVIALFRRGLAPVLVALIAGLFCASVEPLILPAEFPAAILMFAERSGESPNNVFFLFLSAAKCFFALIFGALAVMIVDVKREIEQ